MRISVAVVFTGLFFCALVGCTGDLVELKPPGDMAGSAPVDMAAGGAEMGPVHFYPDIQADLDHLTCTSGDTCHGGGSATPTFLPMPTAQGDLDANYNNFVTFCNKNDPPNSAVIQNSLGMDGHSGGTLITTTSPEYTRWVNWIAAGELR